MESATEEGRGLIEARRRLDSDECLWLVELAGFDSSGLWAEDGHACCAGWLIDRCGFGRSTAFEKLRVAHELVRRPLLADAFASGDLSYSKVRSITSVTDGGSEFDELMLRAQAELTADDVERVVRRWEYCRNQDDPPRDLFTRRGIHRQRGFGGGLGRLVIDDSDENIDRLLNLFEAYLDALHNSSVPVDESAAQTHESEPDPPTHGQRLLDALNDLVETAAACHSETIDVERAAIGVTVSYETLVASATAGGFADLSSGRVISGEAARLMCCDAGIHRIVTRGQSEILDLGRKTRTWNRAQRRAIRARHGNRCAMRGCHRKIVQIHHVQWWEDDGETAINNGIPLCLTHHHLIHEAGWAVSYNPATGVTTFTGPQDQLIESDNGLANRLVA